MIKFKSVKILGVPYTVKSALQVAIARELGIPGAMGYCDDLAETIFLSSEVVGRPLKKLFLHEWVHGVCGVNGLNQTLDDVVAESMAQSIASALLELLEQREVREFLLKSNLK